MSLLCRLLVSRLRRRALARVMMTEVVLAPALPEMILALLALLAFLAAEVWTNFLGAILKHLPVVGNTLANDIGSWINSAKAELDNWLSELTGAMASLVTPVALWPWRLIYEAIGALNHIGGLARYATNTVEGVVAQLPSDLAGAVNQAVGAAEAYVGQVVGQAVGTINGEIAIVVSFLNTYVNQLRASISAEVQRATGAEQTIVSFLNSYVDALTARITAVETALSGEIGSVVQAIDASISSVADQALTEAKAAEQAAIAAGTTIATDLANTAVGGLDQAAHDLVIGPWAALLPALEGIAGALPEAVSDGLSLPGVLGEAVPVSVPGVLAMTVAAVGAVAVEVEDCVVPNCGAMSQLGSLLNGLTDALGLGVLLAFLEECASNPAAAVSDVENTLGGAVSDAGSAFKSLIGV